MLPLPSRYKQDSASDSNADSDVDTEVRRLAKKRGRQDCHDAIDSEQSDSSQKTLAPPPKKNTRKSAGRGRSSKDVFENSDADQPKVHKKKNKKKGRDCQDSGDDAKQLRKAKAKRGVSRPRTAPSSSDDDVSEPQEKSKKAKKEKKAKQEDKPSVRRREVLLPAVAHRESSALSGLRRLPPQIPQFPERPSGDSEEEEVRRATEVMRCTCEMSILSSLFCLNIHSTS